MKGGGCKCWRGTKSDHAYLPSINGRDTEKRSTISNLEGYLEVLFSRYLRFLFTLLSSFCEPLSHKTSICVHVILYFFMLKRKKSKWLANESPCDPIACRVCPREAQICTYKNSYLSKLLSQFVRSENKTSMFKPKPDKSSPKGFLSLPKYGFFFHTLG